MYVRRCTILLLEPRERLDFDLALIAAGGNGLRSTLQWLALAPPSDAEIELSAVEVALLGALSPTQWSDFGELTRTHPRAALEGLLAKALIVAEDSAAAARDEALRDTHWRGVSAALHYGSRWRGVDTAAIQKDLAEAGAGDEKRHQDDNALAIKIIRDMARRQRE